MVRPRAVLGAIAAAWLLIPAAHAAEEGDKARARKLLRTGNELYARGELEAALSLFERAYAAYPSPMLYFNIGRTHQLLGHPLKAAAYYQRFLDQSASPDSDRHTRTIAALEALDAKLGKVRVRGAPPEADVRIAGERRARWNDRAIRVLPGDVRVTAELAGHDPFDTSVPVGAGETVVVAIRMTRTPPPLPEVPPSPPPIAAAVAQRAQVVQADDGSILTEWWFWTLVAAAAGAAIGVTVVATRPGEFTRAGELSSSSTEDWESF